MKKKLLFILGNLESGGVSKSFVNLMNTLDREKFDVTAFICSKSGDVYGQYLPKDLLVLYNQDIADLYQGIAGLTKLLKRFRLILFIGSLLRLFFSLVSKSLAGRLMARLMPVISKDEFDLIVDYNGQQQLYYMVDKLRGKKKISFFHNDYSKWSYYYKADKKYYPKVDGIYTISEICAEALRQYFPDCKDKIGVIENIISPKVLDDLANEYDIEPFKGITFVTVGHFCKRKGSDYAIEVAQKLKQEGIVFRWFFVGRITDEELYNQVKSKELDDVMIFKGILPNPYPYIKAADVYIHPSRFEGKSIALDEAKLLCKPIVITNFSTVNDQFKNRVNGSVVEMDAESIKNAILELINDKSLRESYIIYLKQNKVDNSCEVEKFYTSL